MCMCEYNMQSFINYYGTFLHIYESYVYLIQFFIRIDINFNGH